MRKESKGAVTIFLILVLVPMLLVTSLFVDASKIFLTNSVVESSADLALESALTYYDQDIKDIYGLFATAQNMDEVYDNCEKYFKNMISMSGLNEDDTDFYLNEIMDMLLNGGKSTELSNFLQLEIGDVEIKPVENSSLANPTVLEQQIVDFMKYRSPINTGLSFIEGLKSFNTLNSQKKLVDARKKYYEELKGVMEKLINAWKAINQYNGTDISSDDYYLSEKDNPFPNNNSIEHYYYECTLKNIFDDKRINLDYYSLLELYFKDYTNTSLEDRNSGANYTLWLKFEDDKAQYRTSGSFEEVKPNKTYNRFTIGTDDYKIEQIVKYLEMAYDDYESKYMPNGSNTFPTKKDEDHDTQYWLLNAKEYKNRADEAVKVFKLFYELESACEAADDYNDNIENEVDEDDPDKEIVDPIEYDRGESDAYYRFVVNDMLATNSKCEASYDYANYYHIQESTRDINAYIVYSSRKLNNLYDTSEEMLDYLEDAIENLEKARKSITNGDLKQAMNDWKSAAESDDIKDTKLAKQDQEEIKDLETAFDVDTLNDLITTIGNIKERVKTVKEYVDKFTICDKKIRNFYNVDDLKKVIKSYVNVDNANLNSILSKKQTFYANYYKSQDMNLDWLVKDESCLSFTAHVDANSNQIIDCSKEDFRFYKYLLTQFGQLTEEEEATGKYKDFKKNLNEQAKTTTEGETEKKVSSLGSISETGLPSQGSSASITTNKNTSTDVDKLNETEVVSDNNIANDLLNFGAGLMDRLYVSDYIMSMFSYYTIEQEEKTEEGEAIKSLTLEPISKENHKYYPAEVEYIIYGDKDLSSNVNKAKASIYGLRLAFNIIYAFSASEIRDTASPIAKLISGTTGFVVPAALIQTVIIISIACIESAIDLSRIMNGEKVVLFKSSGTWVTSLTGLNAEGAKNIKLSTKTAIDSGSQVISKLLDSSNEELAKLIEDDTLISDLYAYLDDTISSDIDRFSQEIIQKLNTATNNIVNKYLQTNPVVINIDKNGNAEFDFSKLPIDDIISEIKQSLEEWKNEQSGLSELEIICKEISFEVAIEHINEKFILLFASKKEDEVYTELSAINSNLQRTISGTVNSDARVIRIKDDYVEKITNSAKNSAISLKETLNKEMNNVFASESDNVQESVLPFSYKDYLRFFSVLALYNDSGENAALKRAADLIQINLTKEDNKLDMSKAYTNISIDYSYKSKPMLLSLSLFDGYDDLIDDMFNKNSTKISKGY